MSNLTRVSPTRRGYQARVYEPKPQKYSQVNRNYDDLLVTPLYDEYLVKNPEIDSNPAIFEKVMRQLLTPPRDRRRSFSASQAGNCLRRQELAFLGAKRNPIADPRGARIFQNGTFVHLRWQVGVLSAKIVHGIEVTVTNRTGLWRATLDGIGVGRRGRWEKEKFGWEHKGRMSFAFSWQEKKNTPDEKTRKQVAVQMYLTGYDIFSVTNENKDTQDHGEFLIERNDEEVGEARKEFQELSTAIERGRLHPMLPECIKRNSTGEYYKCPYGTDAGACVNSGNWPRTA